MKITRPYNAEDNETNRTQTEVLKNWAKKHNETIKELEILEAAVIAMTESGREIRVIKADGSTNKNIRAYLSMYETVNGKRIRIKKSEW